MYYKLSNSEYNALKKVEDITCSDYEIVGNFIPVDMLIGVIEDLLVEIDRLEEEKKDREQDIENNYELKETSLYEEYGISEKDFF
jgi:hypothetical protein